MRTLGDARRKAPAEVKQEEAPKEEPTQTPEIPQTDSFDESVTIS